MYEARPGIGSGVSCLTPEPFARAIITKSAPGMSGAWRRKRRRVPSCDQIGSLSIVDPPITTLATLVRGSKVKMSPSREKATRPLLAGPVSGGSFCRAPARTRPAASAPSEQDEESDGAPGRLSHDGLSSDLKHREPPFRDGPGRPLARVGGLPEEVIEVVGGLRLGEVFEQSRQFTFEASGRRHAY